MVRIDVLALREKEEDKRARAKMFAIFHRQMRNTINKESIRTSNHVFTILSFELTERPIVNKWVTWSPNIGGTLLTKLKRLFGMICSQYGYKYTGFSTNIRDDMFELMIRMDKKDAKDRRYIPGLYKRT